ncbi:hypothetical protein [Caldisalinibacter kiritimatiensis]|nr:hypothetical protein [Caldisalinibacter kiritimatiensis]
MQVLVNIALDRLPASHSAITFIQQDLGISMSKSKYYVNLERVSNLYH